MTISICEIHIGTSLAVFNNVSLTRTHFILVDVRYKMKSKNGTQPSSGGHSEEFV